MTTFGQMLRLWLPGWSDAKWSACSDPLKMLAYMEGRASERKLLLFACACRRLPSAPLKSPERDKALQVIERLAETEPQPTDWERIISTDLEAEPAVEYLVSRANVDMRRVATSIARHFLTRDQLFASLEAFTKEFTQKRDQSQRPTDLALATGEVHRVYQCYIARDIFGNPFRPVTMRPTWLTSTVVGLAQSIYDERAFERLPLLADALEEAGADNADVINHCRQPGTHAFGCFVVDAVLGKK